MDSKIAGALSASEKDVNGAKAAYETIYELVERGDLDGALANLHMELHKRLRDAWTEATAAAERLEEMGAVYPPRT